MKYKIKAGTNVLAHTIGTLFDFQDFKKTPTDVDVTLTSGDVWFHKGVKDVESLDSSSWLLVVQEHYIGFKLPENKKEIDCMLVLVEDVETIEDSHVSEDKQLQRKLRQQSDDHWISGQGLPH